MLKQDLSVIAHKHHCTKVEYSKLFKLYWFTNEEEAIATLNEYYEQSKGQFKKEIYDPYTDIPNHTFGFHHFIRQHGHNYYFSVVIKK